MTSLSILDLLYKVKEIFAYNIYIHISNESFC